MIGKKVLSFVLSFIVSMGLSSSFVVAQTSLEAPIFVDPRYQPQYPPRFFESGGPREKFDRNRHLKIGIVIRNRTHMGMTEIINNIFSVSPFDRYREFFVFANGDEAMRQVRGNSQFITAYDGFGRRIGGGFDWESMRVRAGLVVLDVNDYEFRRTGTLGYAFNQTAVTQKSTILHELGHVLGDLGDEYSINEMETEDEMKDLMTKMGKEYEYRYGRQWTKMRANLEYRTRNPFKWFPLIEQGFLPGVEENLRVKMKDGIDVGIYLIPSSVCVMNHPQKSEGKFCPVCQLQIIDRIAELTGVRTPWHDFY